MEKEIQLGTKIKGFKFRNDKNTCYESDDMDSYNGKVGIVISIEEYSNQIKLAFYYDDLLPEFTSDADIENDFNDSNNFDDWWYYPLDKAYKHIVHDSNDLFPIY